VPHFKTICLAIDLATRQRDDAAKVVASVRRTLAFAKDQMAQLEGYAADTDARWVGARDAVLSAELIRHHYQFVERLQQAIRMQTGAIADTQSQVELANRGLLHAEFRLAGLNQVLEARRSAMARTQKRRDQRVTDEFAAMVHSRRNGQAVLGEKP
jgi:flagellar FliJ protein